MAASLSAISLSTLTLAVPTSASGPTNAATATNKATEYVVKPGDFLAGIAAKVGVGLPELLTVNNMTTKSLILPGDKLVLPANAENRRLKRQPQPRRSPRPAGSCTP